MDLSEKEPPREKFALTRHRRITAISAVSTIDDRPRIRRATRQRRPLRQGEMPGKRPRQQLSCKNEVSLIADYLAANLTPQVKQAFDAHLEACPDCVAFLQTYRKTIEITGAFLKLQSLKQRPRRLTLMARTLLPGRR